MLINICLLQGFYTLFFLSYNRYIFAKHRFTLLDTSKFSFPCWKFQYFLRWLKTFCKHRVVPPRCIHCASFTSLAVHSHSFPSTRISREVQAISDNILLHSHGAFGFKNNYIAGPRDWSAVLSRSSGSMIAQNGNVVSQYLYLHSHTVLCWYYWLELKEDSKRPPDM